MKKYQIFFSELAKKDLGNIYAFIEDISSEENAKLVISRIAQRVYRLNVFPERSEILAYSQDKTALRSTTSGKYRIIYTVNKKDSQVIIVRVFSVKQDTKL